MPSRNATIAEAVKAALNTASAADEFSREFTARRVYLPTMNLEAFTPGELVVSVIPRADDREKFSRNSILHGFQVDVAVQQRLTATCNPEAEGGNAELDALLAFSEELADWFDFSGTLGATGAQWFNTEHPNIYAPDHLLNNRLFTSLITVTYRLM